MAWKRWRIPIVVVLAAAAGVAVGRTASWRGLVGLAILAGVVVAGTLVAWVVVLPGRLAPPLPTQELEQITDPKARLETADARLRLRHDLRNGMLQTLAVVAVLAGAVLGFWQLAEDRSTAAADRELTRQGQASERFTRAISQLSEKQPVETRIGAIYGLAQVAEQAPDNNSPVGEVLLAWINHLRRPNKPTPDDPPLSEHAPDVQAALTVLTQYDKNDDGTKDYAWLAHRLDLSGFSLKRADLHGADLHGANLFNAGLYGARLDGANLSGTNLFVADLYGAQLRDAALRGANLESADLLSADFGGADLRGARIGGADLRGAQLHDADLRGAQLGGVDLRGAQLRGARLNGADLHEANLISKYSHVEDRRGADFTGGDLRDANLNGAVLSDANFTGANLSDANFIGADLRDANFTGANLSGATLDGAKLYSAIADSTTVWPVGFDWRRAGVKLI